MTRVDSMFSVRVLGVAALCSLLGGCVIGPKYTPPSPKAPPAYKESPANAPVKQPAAAAVEQADPTLGGLGTWTVAQPQDSMLRGKWWEIYNEPELNALEEQLNINNQNVQEFFENFMAARALVREARSQYYPNITAGFSYSHSHSSANVGTGGGVGRTTSLIDLPLGISWEPDLWGRVRNSVHASQYNAQLSAADLEGERLTEQASLAALYFELRGQDALQQIVNSTVATDQKALEFTQTQYKLGLTTQLSVVQARNTLQLARSQATNLGIARAQFEHAIAVLIGKAPSELTMPVRPLLATPPAIPLGLPSQLLERRPDVAAAERRMAAANAQIGIASAAYYPNVGLSAGAGIESSAWKRLLNWPSRFWSLGSSVSQTIFDAGLRRATVNQTIAAYNADLAAFRQTVLEAFRQVEDALSQLRILTEQIQQQHEAVESAETALDLEMKRYKLGLDPYINVVTEQNILLGAQESLAILEINRMTASVSLIEVLGGGWDRSQLPTPEQVAVQPTKSDTTIQQ